MFVSSLTNKLKVRITNYFDTQVRVPSAVGALDGAQYPIIDENIYANNLYQIHQAQDPSIRKMSDQQRISWYSKILESVRLRYRKLQRFAR